MSVSTRFQQCCFSLGRRVTHISQHDAVSGFSGILAAPGSLFCRGNRQSTLSPSILTHFHTSPLPQYRGPITYIISHGLALSHNESDLMNLCFLMSSHPYVTKYTGPRASGLLRAVLSQLNLVACCSLRPSVTWISLSQLFHLSHHQCSEK
jgi:hypothetical protein